MSAIGNTNKVTAVSGYIQTNAFSNSWNNDNDARFLVDELRVGMSWDEITPVPEPATFALLFGILAFILLLRRRSHH